jgi:hypothetical protein
LPPAATSTDLASSFIQIFTLPEETKSFRANKIIKTIKFTASVKTRTPKNISFCRRFIYKEIPPKDKNPKHISPTVIKVIPNP